ncbi:hypothetical protein V2J94_46230 [Streptomyces sp. DSM 41524]|uniref:Uncharacterized protein n=1 Tax=Streptomyces asiaticus subsp. ignotus TaxID=3098222 RepID=A0ABU7QCK3_9ACTN|nr:hypothetical protein [Streptomyces sp. DSM 41524]
MHRSHTFVELAELPVDGHGGMRHAALPAYRSATELLGLSRGEFTGREVTRREEFFDAGGRCWSW